MIGKTVSRYKILEQIGAGGMGVVYKAEDVSLERTVALKFLSTHALASEAEERRFVREAQASASLNHPNITTIFEIDRVDGQFFIAMEFVEGSSLAERIAESPLKLSDAFNIALQIADGLRAAHQRGIIHRDVKPGNVLLGSNHSAKLSDFGLAKIADRTKITRSDVTIGTAAYMSPEQAQGQKLDRRSDIFSLGVVLYEMLTGRLPFKGDYEHAVVYAIVNEAPEPVTALRTGLPIELDRILAKALAKQPEARYQHLDDMSVDLRNIADALDSGHSRSSRVPVDISMPSFRWARMPAGFLGGLLLGAGVLYWQPWNSGQPAAVARYEINLPTGLKLGESPSVALSKDAQRIVFAAIDSSGTSHLYQRRRHDIHVTRVPGTEGGQQPFLSPNGEWAGFFADGKLKKVSLERGSVITLCESPVSYGGYWSTDQRIIISPAINTSLVQVPATGGAPTPVTKTDIAQRELTHRWPHVLPDGKWLLFTAETGMDSDAKRLMALNLVSGDRHLLIKQATHAQFLRPGFLVFVRGGALYAVRLDPETARVRGLPVRLLGGVRFSGPGAGDFRLSDDGTLIWVPAPEYIPTATELGGTTSFRRVPKGSPSWVDRTGKKEPLALPKLGYWAPSISPDGKRIAINVDLNIYIHDTERRTLDQFTFVGKNHLAVWSFDSRQIIYSRSYPDAAPYDVVRKNTDGSGPVESILLTGQHTDPAQLVMEDHVLLYAEQALKTGWDIWYYHLKGDSIPKPFLVTENEEYNPAISPDSRWLAYTSNESGRLEVYARAFPAGGQKIRLSTDGGAEPLWAHDGSEIYYRNGGKMMAVRVAGRQILRAGTPKFLFELHKDPREIDPRGSPNYDLAPDGRFLMIENEPTPPFKRMNIVLNWVQEVEQMLPE